MFGEKIIFHNAQVYEMYVLSTFPWSHFEFHLHELKNSRFTFTPFYLYTRHWYSVK